MITSTPVDLPESQRIVITGIGLTAPNGNDLGAFRESLLEGRSGVIPYEIRYVGKTLAGVCDFDTRKYQARKDSRRGTRAGSVGIYSSREAIVDSGLDWENTDKAQVGIYIGVTEHGNVETENEIFELKGVRLRHLLLVSPSQSSHRRQQSGGRDCTEHGCHWSSLHDRSCMCGG